MTSKLHLVPLHRQAIALAFLAMFAPAVVRADTILASRHNLSVSGPGEIRATIETEVCAFCHTPHKGSGPTPLWSHQMSQATYTPYNSSTIKAAIGQPTGSSKLCLSCHDGTVALGMTTTRPGGIPMRDGVTTLPPGRTRIGTDLSDDHPISFTYDVALANTKGELKNPGMLNNKVRLDHNSQMQCTSCHDPHDNQFGKFLVQPNVGSALCVECHQPDRWDTSAHRLSNRTWNGAGINPWPTTNGLTVAANACGNCHSSHNAGTKQRLLNFPDEEQNCTSCHNGNVATKNVEADFAKFSTHPIRGTTRVHDPIEDTLNPPRHVECADCHNPHAANGSDAVAPNASGALAGVAGVNQDGAVVQSITREYELCFRCHGDSISRGPAHVPRQFVQTNTRLEFAPSSASFHPVVTQGKNLTVPSLLSPLTPASRMYCTDCHNSNTGPNAGGSGANGPHGSSFPPILEQQLVLADGTAETSGTYALCYKCHNRNSILADESFPHRKHVVDKQTSCVTCHDPHGVQNAARLINFNSFYATPSSNGRLEYVSTGTFSGNCSVTCHGVDHDGDVLKYNRGMKVEAPAGAAIRRPKAAPRLGNPDNRNRQR